MGELLPRIWIEAVVGQLAMYVVPSSAPANTVYLSQLQHKVPEPTGSEHTDAARPSSCAELDGCSSLQHTYCGRCSTATSNATCGRYLAAVVPHMAAGLCCAVVGSYWAAVEASCCAAHDLLPSPTDGAIGLQRHAQ